MEVYRGRAEFAAYLAAVADVEGGTISPGGGCLILGCSRQYIYDLMKRGDVRAWVFYEDRGKHAAYTEVSVVDLVAYALRNGWIKSVGDIPLAFPGKEEIFAKCRDAVLT